VPVLTVMMGPPGAGKTTWIAANIGPDVVVCSTERIRTDAKLKASQGGMVAYLAGLRRRAEQGLGAGRDVLVDGCNTRRQDRTTWLRIARERGASTHLVVVDAPLSDLLRAQRERGRRNGVPEEKVRKYHIEYQRALHTIHREGWSAITTVRRGEEPAPLVLDPQPLRVSKW